VRRSASDPERPRRELAPPGAPVRAPTSPKAPRTALPARAAPLVGRFGRLARARRRRLALLCLAGAALLGALVLSTPHLRGLVRPFEGVSWRWLAAAFAANLISILVRAGAWWIVLSQALPPPRPGYRSALSAYGVGLLGNTVVPGRVGEFARVLALARRLPPRRERWAPVAGSVLAQRMLDGLGFVGLVGYVLVAARIPSWAFAATLAVLGVGVASLAAGLLVARRHEQAAPAGLGRARRLWLQVRQGLGVLRAPAAFVRATALELCGWTAQLLVVWLSLRAFATPVPLAAAGLVLLAVNAVLAFPVWPGGVGLYQAAVALVLVPYGLAYADGFAAGVGVQAVESVTGIGVGLVFLAHEGLSLAQLRQSASGVAPDGAAPPGRAGGEAGNGPDGSTTR
jgi:uncharacterized membrane protein YbhN (UPF0104 family)